MTTPPPCASTSSWMTTPPLCLDVLLDDDAAAVCLDVGSWMTKPPPCAFDVLLD